MEAEVARLVEKTDTHGRSLDTIWQLLQKASESSSKQDLILFRLDEMSKKFDSHDTEETKRTADHETRLSELEKTDREFRGAFRAVVSGVALIGSLIGGGVTALFEHYLASGK